MNDVGDLRQQMTSVRVDERRNAVLLVDRLVAVESRVMDLESENAKLRRLHTAPRDAHDDVSTIVTTTTTHEWPLADRAELHPSDLSNYDVRVDDDVVVTGRRGEEFMKQFDLSTEKPAFVEAIAQLNSMARQCSPTTDADVSPDASIVIPLYGQLAYTLNCLDSLFIHASKYRAEIILIDDASPDETGALLPLVSGIRYFKQPQNGGFIISCNTGAALARGRCIIMLNNDTRVVPGWLDELVSSFDLWPNAGLVGSKMHYADGSLQEAGGIIWRDGSAWNYGRNDDPNRPQYAHARQVDYISGCSFAVPATIWQALGGFDRRFMPAYCEDADMALAIRDLGKEVWFQPQSRIVHYEGKTGGTDTGKGVKAYQVQNTKKLFLKWRDLLSRHRPNGVSPFFERERSVERRVLVVDVSAPTPDQDAGSVQTVLGIRACQMLGYKVHFVPEDNWLFQSKYTPPMQREGVECAYAPYDLGFENYLRQYGSLFDVIMVYRINVMEKTLEIIKESAPQAVILFHVADLHYLRMERTARLHGDLELLESALLMKAREFGVIGKVDCTITHSHFEQEVITAEVPEAPVAVWPIMVEFFGTEKAFSDRRDIVFLGGYRHPPNVDAVLYFVREVFPRILERNPTLRFIVAGANPTDEIRALAGENVVVTGLVDDLRTILDACRIFVCPLRVGAGIKGKIMTALSYGIPIVTTAIGIEGTSLRNERDLLVAEDPQDFASATLRLYEDHALWNTLSAAGQELVEATLSVRSGSEFLKAAIDKAYTHKLAL